MQALQNFCKIMFENHPHRNRSRFRTDTIETNMLRIRLRTRKSMQCRTTES